MFSIPPISPRAFVEPNLERFATAREDKALLEMEELFLNMLLTEMRKSQGSGGLFERSYSVKSYEEMLDTAVARQMAESGQFGLAESLREQIRIQETSDAHRLRLHENFAQMKNSQRVKE